MAHLTVLQRTNLNGFPKAGELIDITGAHALEAMLPSWFGQGGELGAGGVAISSKG